MYPPAEDDECGGSGPGSCCGQQSTQHASSDLLVWVSAGRQPFGETSAEDKPRSTQRYLYLKLHYDTLWQICGGLVIKPQSPPWLKCAADCEMCVFPQTPHQCSWSSSSWSRRPSPQWMSRIRCSLQQTTAGIAPWSCWRWKWLRTWSGIWIFLRKGMWEWVPALECEWSGYVFDALRWSLIIVMRSNGSDFFLLPCQLDHSSVKYVTEWTPLCEQSATRGEARGPGPVHSASNYSHGCCHIQPLVSKIHQGNTQTFLRSDTLTVVQYVW